MAGLAKRFPYFQILSHGQKKFCKTPTRRQHASKKKVENMPEIRYEKNLAHDKRKQSYKSETIWSLFIQLS